ncbi:GGDEF domain-containing protein [Thermodesulfovibrio hydrogeniphilus]
MFKKFLKKDTSENFITEDLMANLIREKFNIFAKSLQDNDAIVVFIVDDNYDIKYVNKGFLKITNYLDNPIDKNIRDFTSKKLNELPEILENNFINSSIDLLDFKNKIYNALKGVSLKVGNYIVFIITKSFYKADKLTAKIIQSTKEANELKLKLAELDKKFQETLTELTYKDILTGLYNRKYLAEYLPIEIEKYKRYKNALSIVLLDINQLKYINLNYGRTTGDLLLKSFSKLIHEIIRNVDWAVRYEEDEFIIVLPITNYEGAGKLIDRIKKKVERTLFEKAFTLTINAVAVECNELDDYDSLINRAFALLKESKYFNKNNQS